MRTALLSAVGITSYAKIRIVIPTGSEIPNQKRCHGERSEAESSHLVFFGVKHQVPSLRRAAWCPTLASRGPRRMPLLHLVGWARRSRARVGINLPHPQRIFFLFLIALFALPAWGQKPAANSFPNEVAGWKKTGETRTFTAANLWQYIDGDAEKYLKAGAESVSTADYKLQNKVEAVADVYTMRDAEAARKFFASEPARSAKPVSLGERASLSQRSLLFQSGRHLVRIVAYDELPKAGPGLLDLGRAILQRLPK